MKYLVAFSCLLAVACANPNLGLINPLAYGSAAIVRPVGGFGYSSVTPHLSPIAYSSQIAHAPIAHHVAAPIAHHVPAPIAYSAPVVAAPVAVAPAIEKTQYHAQDELGQASYGHAEAFQNHNAVQDAHGNKAGSYNYVAPDGQVISASYVADALGYRVASNALPVGPNLVPVGPVDTPEVIAARAAHLNAFAVVKSRLRRSVLAYGAPLGYAAPLAYSGAVVAPGILHRPATLTTVVNNPGHAVSYRID